MKKEDVLEKIDKLIIVEVDAQSDFDYALKFQNELRSIRSKISGSRLMAMDIYNQVKDKLEDIDRLSIVLGINKLTLAFSHLGTSIKNNRQDFNENIIISTFLKEKAGNIAASTSKDMLEEIVNVLISEPKLVQVTNYEKALRKELVKNGWEIGDEYEAKDQKLNPEFFEGYLPQPQRNLFAEYIKYRDGFMYPYATVVNKGTDVKPVIDTAAMSNVIDHDLYKDDNNNRIQSYEALNVFQRIDWFRKQLGVIMSDLESLDEEDYDIHISMSGIEVHDTRVYFGHLLGYLNK